MNELFGNNYVESSLFIFSVLSTLPYINIFLLFLTNKFYIK